MTHFFRRIGSRLADSSADPLTYAWREIKKLKWAIIVAFFPILLLDVLDLRMEFTSSMRWVPVLQRLGNVSMAVVLAHLIRSSMFPYLSLGDTLAEALKLIRDPAVDGLRSLAAAVVLFGVCVLVGAVLVGVIIGFTLGL